MRKIYPPFFIKFAVFVLYILSITVVTLAQDTSNNSAGSINGGNQNAECQTVPVSFTKNQVIIGYVQYNTAGIKWSFYDYINVIAFPSVPNGANNGYSSVFPPGNNNTLKNLVSERNTNNANTKILLSIRNYDPLSWPPDNPADADRGRTYDELIREILSSMSYLDGVDIEYPGMRGMLCNALDNNRAWDINRDTGFLTFISKLRNQMPNGKIIMITVGSNTFNINQNPNLNLNNLIDFLNIETYHYGLYEIFISPNVQSYPNSPFSNVFDNAYNAWKNTGIDSSKIIMGVDFGNTFQVVSNQDIQNSPSVPMNGQSAPNPIPPFPGLKRINSLCSTSSADDNIVLFSWPWKNLTSQTLDGDCNGAFGWTRKFDPKSLTPWLYKSNPATSTPSSPDYFYVSYEDYTSLSRKLNYSATASIGGMSISDVSYDDNSGTLLNYMQVIRGKGTTVPTPTGSPPGSSDNGGKGKASTSSSNSTTNADKNPTDSTTDHKTDHKTGAIVGGIIGSVIGLGLLGAAGLFYRQKYQKSPSLRDIPPKGSIGTHQVKDAEISTESPQNRFVPAPTTVIPIASGYVTAMFDFNGKEENDLSFKKGDKIEILERGDGPNDWWVGRVNGAVGEFPGNYVKET